MRRPGGHYGGDTGGSHPYSTNSGDHHHQHQQQQQHNKADHHHHNQNQWKWERDAGPKLTSPMSPHMLNEDVGREGSRSYHQGQRPDPRMPLEKQGNNDARSQRRDEDMEIGYQDNAIPRTFDGLEQKFLEDIMKLSKEQSDAEDAEYARHRERINAINAQYQEQLVALRSQHTNRRDEYLRKESHARQQQYQQAASDGYPSRGMGPRDPHGYNAPAAEPHRAYNSDDYDAYRERARYLDSARDHGFEPRVPYPEGRVYNTGSRYR